MEEPLTPQNLPDQKPEIPPGPLPLRCSKWNKANRPYYNDTVPKRTIVPKGFAIVLLVVAIVLISRRLPQSSTSPEDADALLNHIVLLQLTEADIHQGNLILVNSQHPYIPPSEEQEFTPVSHGEPRADKAAEGKLLPRAAKALNRMLEAFSAETGRTIWVEATYRSQEDAARQSTSCDEAAAGSSEHYTGLAVDFVSAGEPAGTLTSQDAQWLQQHAAGYGFIWRYPEGKEQQTGTQAQLGHFRYVGSPHASMMKALDLTLEEYLDRIRQKHPWNGEHLLCQAGDLEYEIYYVPVAEEGFTQAPVPKTGEYTLSGNNQSGFIVTSWQPKVGDTKPAE